MPMIHTEPINKTTMRRDDTSTKRGRVPMDRDGPVCATCRMQVTWSIVPRYEMYTRYIRLKGVKHMTNWDMSSFEHRYL